MQTAHSIFFADCCICKMIRYRVYLRPGNQKAEMESVPTADRLILPPVTGRIYFLTSRMEQDEDAAVVWFK